MTESSLTLDVLYDLLRRERNSAPLQELPLSFLDQFKNYLSEKSAYLEELQSKQPGSTKVDHVYAQIRSIKRVFIQLFDKRESKIIDLAQMKVKNPELLIDDSSMLEHEAELFNVTLKQLTASRKYAIDLVGGALPTSKHVVVPQAPAENKLIATDPDNPGEKQTDASTKTPASSQTSPTPSSLVIGEDNPAAATANSPSTTQQPASASSSASSTLSNPADSVLVHFVLKLEKFEKDGASYGPYDKDEIALLPSAVAHDLSKQGQAKILEE